MFYAETDKNLNKLNAEAVNDMWQFIQKSEQAHW